MSRYFRAHIAIPQDHGSWVFLFSPLLIGIFAAEQFTAASLLLVVATLAAFLMRQPVSIAVKVWAKRRPASDLPAALLWSGLYGTLALVMLAGLVAEGHGILLWLAAPAVPVFGWHLWLISRRDERKQAGVEMLATGVLALAAPAALWVGNNTYDPLGWALWALTWLQSAASIVHAYLKLAQRDLDSVPAQAQKLKMAGRALAYTTFNLTLAVFLAVGKFLPWGIFLPYLLQWAETVYATLNPALGAKPVQIGVRQLIISTLFTVLFIITWRLP
jgi:hypothetical protein